MNPLSPTPTLIQEISRHPRQLFTPLRPVTKFTHSLSRVIRFVAIIGLVLGITQNIYSQCQAGVTVPTYQVDLQGSPGGFVAGSFTLGGECCPIQGQNSCLILEITVGTEFTGAGICFDPPCSVTGYIFPSTATDFCPLPGTGFNVCQTVICTPPEGTTFYLLLCKPGAASNPLDITIYGVAEPNLNITDVTEGCATTFEVTGAVEFTCNGGNAPPTETPLPLTWTTNIPGALDYLSCTDCSNPTFMYTGPPVADCDGLTIEYTVSIPETECFDSISVTRTVTVYPDISGAITSECDATGMTATLTFTPDLPCPDLVYTWTDENNMVVGTMSSVIVPADGSEYCLSVSRTAAPLCSPFTGCVTALCCTLEVMCPPANGGVFSCVDDIPAADPSLIVVIDSCGPITITSSDVTMGTGCPLDSFMLVRTYLISDGMDEDTCIQTFKAIDTTAPTIACPADVTVQCASLVAAADVMAIVASDNCGGTVTVTVAADVITGMTCVNRFIVTRVYTATDLCGNTATCAQIITVFDDTPPTIACPADVTVECASLVPAANVSAVVTSDNCGGSPTVTVAADVITGQTCENRYTITRVYTSTDICGNAATCAQIITVFDDTAPTIACPADVTVECASLVPAADISLVITSDNCGGAVTVTVAADVITGQTCANRYIITRVYTATDLCGNVATCAQIITVFDNTAPMITCPADVTVECASLVPAANVALVITSDNCGGTPTVTVAADVITGQSCANRYIITRVYTSTDICGNAATCAQIITVFDDTLPTISCPADVTVECASLVPAVNVGAVIASDNCGGTVTVTAQADVITGQTCADRYTITRVYVATDLCGNTATCAQIITVFDDTVPTISCPADVTVECTNLVPAVNVGAIITSDNCGGNVTVTAQADVITGQTCADRYTITRVYVATDLCGNTATCAQIITVFDDTVPTITCPADVTVACANLVPAVNVGAVITSDNCGGTVTVTAQADVITGQTCANRYTITRVYVATDLCGNTATCAQIITVFDDTAPTITCPADVTVECASLVPAADVSAVVTSDNCGGVVTVTVAADVITGQTCANRYTITRVYTATDLCGNVATCAQIITVFDDTAPAITCPADVTVECASLVPAANIALVITSDNCGGTPTVTVAADVITGQTCANRYIITRVYSSTDICGNVATCAQIITVFDDTLPTITCPADVTVECASLVPAANIALVTTSDNCGGTPTVTVAADVITGQTCANRYIITRVYSATDICGNVATCAQIITVFDDTVPTITCPADVTVECTNLVPAVNVGAIITSDNCGGTVTVTAQADVITGQTCADRYTITRVYVATDLCGNTATCAQIITVFDDTVPTITCPADVTVECSNLVPAVNVGAIIASDNCGGTVTVTAQADVITGQTCADRYTITRVYVATDLCGNTATCAQIITVFDDTVPTITCPADVTVECANLVPSASTTAVIASDNCGGAVTVTFAADVITNQTCADRFTITRVYTATDLCGNTATCAQIITVFDDTAPTITCPANVTVQCASLVPAANVAAVTASDNCGGTVTVTVAADVITGMTCVNRFTVTRVYTATDVCGNTATCAQIITVFDGMAPIMTCPANVTVNCDASTSVEATGFATATDNCGGMPEITMSDITTAGTCPQEYTITRTFIATDECGNSTACSQIISVQDTVPPVFSIQCQTEFDFYTSLGSTCPQESDASAIFLAVVNGTPIGPNETWSIGNNILPALGPCLSDNCGNPDSAIILASSFQITGDSCLTTFTVVFDISDECGNAIVGGVTFIVRIHDDTPPVIACPADVTIECGSSTLPADTGMPTATDDCNTVAFDYTDFVCDNPVIGFNGAYNFANWNIIIPPQGGSVVAIGDDEVILVGPNGGLCAGASTMFSIVVPTTGELTFNWEYSTADIASFFDPFGYNLNGTFVQLTDNAGSNTQSGTAIVNVMAGDVFAFEQQSTDCIGGAGTTSAVQFVACDNEPVCTQLIQRTHIATDECGNSSSCVQQIFIEDTTAPTITCPANITVECTESTDPADTGIATATDNCSIPEVVSTDVTVAGNCAQEYLIIRTWTATDVCGATSMCTQTINVDDSEAPSITCPANLTVQCASLVPAPNPEAVVAFDSCGLATVSFVGDVITGQTCINRYTITRTYMASDLCGNSATCAQIITVFDNTVPTITCPANLTVQCASLVPVANTSSVTATDNCNGTPVITVLPDVITNTTCINRFTITRIYVATDECGNSATCAQVIEVFDNTVPTIICPANVTVQCASQVPVASPTAASASDNCGPVVITVAADSISNMTCVNRFTITRVYTATDACNNTATCAQIITVFDDTPPVLSPAPANITVQCDAVPPQAVLTATDNCDGPVLVLPASSIMQGSCPDSYIINRSWMATDACGNTATASQIVVVIDTQAPVFVGIPANVTVQCDAVPPPATPTATDNCDAMVTIDFVEMTLPGTCADSYTLIRTWTATDNCANSTTATQSVVVVDTQAPVFAGIPANVTVQCNAVPLPAMPTATDNCDTLVTIDFVEMEIPGACADSYTLIRTWTATDNCANSTSASQTIVVIDTQAPVFAGVPANVTVQCDSVPIPATPTATDNCDTMVTIDFVEISIPGACPDSYTLIRTWTATDNCANLATASQTVVVQDTTPPVAVFIPPDLTVECDANIDSILAEVPIFMDNCDPDVPAFGSIEVIFNEACPQAPTYIQAWTGVDTCGNSTTVGRTVVVIDTTAPELICPLDLTIDCGESTSPDSTGLATATDNCQDTVEITSTDSIIPGACPQEMTILRTWTAVDFCGNESTCVQTIEVQDTIPPTIVCPANVTVQCASLVPPFNIDSVSATDNCGVEIIITHVGDVITNMTCVNRFTLTRTYSATDECGNSATCNQVITVFDNTVPTLTCPAGVTVQCASQVPPANITSVTSTDNCGGTAIITHVGDVVTNMTCVNRFTLTRTYRATDECGNSATCAQVITVFDNTPPTLTCPAAVTVQCAALVPAVNIASVTSTDNCGGVATITHVGDVITNMTCANRFTLTRTYRATDACGNSATCSQVITVFDNTPPTITCPAPVTVQCAAQVPPVNTGSVVTADNCGGAVTVTHVSDVVTNQTCINRFTLTRTYRATDVCGNSATCTQVITVFDNTAPVITFTDPLLNGVPNGGTVEVQCFGQDPEWELPSFSAGSISVTDNCAGTVTVVFTDDLIDEGDCEVDGYINRYRLTWTATDACGNSSSAFVFLELVDLIPPVIHNIPEDITVSCDEIPAPPLDIFATDECLCACVILFEESDPAPGCQDGQVITRTWTAEDDCGNVTVEVQNITLVDDEGPEIIMEHPALAGIESGTILQYTCNEGGIPDFFDELNAESVSSPVSCGTSGDITFTDRIIIANNCKFWGYIEDRTYSWQGVDQCGNVTTFTITAQLIDTEPPVIVGVPDTACIDDPILRDIEVIDNCQNASLTYWDIAIDNPCGDGEAFRRTYEGYDNCGNYVRDTVILIPNDQSAPVPVFVNPKLAELAQGEVLIVECESANGQYTPYGPEDVIFTDACMSGGDVQFAENLMDSGNCSDGVIAVVELVWTARDACGNLGQVIITAHIVDNTPPQFVNYEVDITIGCDDEMPVVTAVDNCGFVALTTVDQVIPGACEYEYDIMRMHTATDLCGNSTVRRQLIHVEGSGPVIEGVIEEVCDDLSVPDVTAFDPCAGEFVGVTMQEDTLDVPCNDGLVIERIWTATDACGNVSEIVQHIVLNDQTPPEILVPTNSIIRRFEGHLNNLVQLSQTGFMEQLNALNATSVFVLDDCDQEIEAEYTLDVIYSENCEEDGYFERRTYTWVATDVCGNSESITFTVDIMDDIPPVLAGVPENETIICGQLPPVANVTATDPANPVEMDYVEVMLSGDGPTDFIVIRTWTATDACGNSAQASQTIIWIPDTFIDCNIALPGSVECNSHGVVIGSDVFGGLPGYSYLWEIEGEKCFIQSGQGTPEIIIYVGWSEVEISLTVTDAFGCSSVCSATLECIDPLDPIVITIPEVSNPDLTVPQSTPSGKDLIGDVLQQFNLWPNPANASVNLSFESSIEHEVQFTLTNYLGQVVLSEEFEAVKGFNTRKIDVSTLADGSYLMQLISETETRTKMLVLFGK